MTAEKAPRYVVNHDDLAHEIIDDELVVVNFVDGNYYSSNASGARIWCALAAEVPFNRIIEAYADDEGAAIDIIDFVQQLLANDLIRPSDADQSPTVESGLPERPSAGWQRPELKTYTDVADLIKLDPVHDAAPSGWPDVNEVAQSS